MPRLFPRVRQTASVRSPQASFRPALEHLEARTLLDAGMAGFTVTNLVSDLPGVAAHTDAQLINPWGFAETPQGQFQVSLNGSGLSERLNAQGETIGQPVVLPSPAGSSGPTTPNGALLNTTSDFVITENGKSAPATFLVSTEDGTIVGFNPQLDATHGVILADQSAAGAVYKLLAEAPNSMGNFLFATNFHNNSVDVFDKNGNKVTLGQNGWGTFTDPNEPAGFAPFGIKLLTINGQDRLFVSYAKQKGPDNHDDQEGPGNGFIDEFSTTGQFIQRFATGSAVGGTAPLNSPIGMAVAPAGFGPGGKFGGALLVGNFGDSHVSAFDLQTGQFLGQLSDAQGNPLTLNGGVGGSGTKGLWGIGFGTGEGGTNPNTLYFAAGVNDESDGLFGTVTMNGEDHGHGSPGPKRPENNPGPTTGLPAVEMRLQQVFGDLAQIQSQFIMDVGKFGPSALNMPMTLLMNDPMLNQEVMQFYSDEIALITTVEQTLIDAVFSNLAASGGMGR